MTKQILNNNRIISYYNQIASLFHVTQFFSYTLRALKLNFYIYPKLIILLLSLSCHFYHYEKWKWKGKIPRKENAYIQNMYEKEQQENK